MFDSVANMLQKLPPWVVCALGMVIGVAMLLYGGHVLVHGAVAIARRMGMSVLLIGLTIVAAGTSAPELAFNIMAGLGNEGELCFGNVIGSNIANIGLVLGLCAIVGTLTVHSMVVRRELPWLVGISGLMFALALLPTRDLLAGDPKLGYGWIDGLIFIIFFILILRFWYLQARKEGGDPLAAEVSETAAAERIPSLTVAWLWFALGLAALLAGGQITKVAAVQSAELLGLSKALVGLTIVAVATSLPEVVTSVIAVRKGHTDLAVGNVVGSNLFNILLVLGVTTLIAPVPLPGIWGWYDLSAMLLLTIALFPIALTTQRRVSRTEGAMLLGAYLLYVSFGVFREYRADLIERWFNI